MKVSLKQINGPWDQGWVLDKHMVSSTFLGNDDRGYPCFDNQRTEIGEATYQLKYQKDWTQVSPLAQALATNVFPKLNQVGFVVPMPASNIRQRQPVTEVALALGRAAGLLGSASKSDHGKVAEGFAFQSRQGCGDWRQFQRQ